MNQNVTDLCKLAITESCSRPCAWILNRLPDYYVDTSRSTSKKATFINLPLIRRKLEIGAYTKIAEFVNDVKSLKELAFRTYQPRSLEGSCIEQFFVDFEKRIHKILLSNSTKWAFAFAHYANKLQFLCAKKSPDVYNIRRVIATTLMTTEAVSEFYAPVYSVPKRQTVHEDNRLETTIRRFLESTVHLSTAVEAREMWNIILKEQPDLEVQDQHVMIDMSLLEQKTLNELINYSKRRCEELRIPYPK